MSTETIPTDSLKVPTRTENPVASVHETRSRIVSFGICECINTSCITGVETQGKMMPSRAFRFSHNIVKKRKTKHRAPR